jgi:two-component system, OmpR family, copper resistance phosphate regulon response regulator CusR
MKKILVIEDEIKVVRALKKSLEEEHYIVTLATTGEEGFFLATTEIFDLVVVDIMLPGRSGLEILDALRNSGDQVPVLILTARDAVEDRIQGLDVGADDYLVKPFAMGELLARIRSLLRRGRPDQATHLQIADLEINLFTRQARRDGRVIDLTAREFDLLAFLMRHQGRFVSRKMIARDVWQETMRATSIDNIIDVHITRLRKKIDKDFDTALIHTIRGVGFIIKEGNA